jgi:hypothetical protein
MPPDFLAIMGFRPAYHVDLRSYPQPDEICPLTRLNLNWTRYDAALTVAGMVLRVRYGVSHPRRLTAGAVADEAWIIGVYAWRMGRAVPRRRPRIAAGSALVVAGSAAQLWAASAEPLR